MKKTLRGAVALTVAMGITASLFSACGRREPPEKKLDFTQTRDLYTSPLAQVAVEPQDHEVIARVDGAEIRYGEVRREVDRLMRTAQQREMPPEQLAALRQQLIRQAADRRILKHLLLNEAERQNIVATEEDLAKARERLLAQLPPGRTLEDILAEQGIPQDEFEDEFIADVRIAKLIEQNVAAPEEPTEAEVTKFYEDHKDRMDVPERVSARHILVSVPPNATPEEKERAREKAESLRAQLLAGADFAALAAEHSDCPSKQQGGQLRPFGRGEMVKAFEDAAFAQAKDEIGPVVESPYGFHIIQVTNREPAHTLTLDEIRGDLIRGMKFQQQQRAVQEYIERLKAKANVEITGVLPPPPGR